MCSERRKLRILWVERDALMRKTVELAMPEHVEHIALATSPREARRLLAAESYDWIVCDDYARGRKESDAFVRDALADGHRVAIVTGDATRPRLPDAAVVFEKPVELPEMLDALERASVIPPRGG